MIPDPIRDDVRTRSENLLLDLDAPANWLDEAVRAYNHAAVARPDEAVLCNPLLSRLLFDRPNDTPVTVPAIQRLITYYKALPEFSARGWSERRTAILGNDFAAFHSALAEISLHEAQSAIPGLSVRFINPEPGGRRRADYELCVGGATLEAEFKSILSEQVRIANGTRFVGINIDAATARAVWRKFTQPIRERQIDTDRPSVVFVDISVCDELYMFLALQRTIRRSELLDHVRTLLDQLTAARRASVPASLLFMLCGFEPKTYQVLFIAPLPSAEDSAR